MLVVCFAVKVVSSKSCVNANPGFGAAGVAAVLGKAASFVSRSWSCAVSIAFFWASSLALYRPLINTFATAQSSAIAAFAGANVFFFLSMSSLQVDPTKMLRNALQERGGGECWGSSVRAEAVWDRGFGGLGGDGLEERFGI